MTIFDKVSSFMDITIINFNKILQVLQNIDKQKIIIDKYSKGEFRLDFNQYKKQYTNITIIIIKSYEMDNKENINIACEYIKDDNSFINKYTLPYNIENFMFNIPISNIKLTIDKSTHLRFIIG